MLDLKLIEEAKNFLQGKVRRTPIEYSPKLSTILGVDAFLKLENLQITGSFKIRGAFFRLSKIHKQQVRQGVATCSAGNHGKALAFAGKSLGIPVTVYVPKSVDQSKLEGIKSYGANVFVSDFSGYDETEIWARKQAATSQMPFISAFDEPEIMAGNGGTLAEEILKDLPKVQNIVLPIGGGGLAAGLSFYAKAVSPQISLIGCQHELSPALALSLQQKKAVTWLPAVETAAGGIEGGIGAETFEIIKTRISKICLLSEEEIFQGFRFSLQYHQYLIEPSAAVVISSVLSGKLDKLSGPTLFVLSGRNASMELIRQILCAKGPQLEF
ncbi:MAG: hydroxyectoine utilization dehydratase EutB [Simkaniaceae bacterium]